jgi:hypothetical protein
MLRCSRAADFQRRLTNAPACRGFFSSGLRKHPAPPDHGSGLPQIKVVVSIRV